MLLRSLKPSPKLIRSLLRPSSLSFNSLSFAPLISPSSSSDLDLDLNAGEIAAAFKDWFRRSAAPLSSLDRIYSALCSVPDVESALSRLDLRLSEDLVLRVLRHRPHPSVPPDDLLLLRLRFFDWSGRQRCGYRHTRSAYHAIFRILSRTRSASLLLDWLHLFSSPASRHHQPPSFLRGDAALARQPRFHDTLVVGYAVAGRPEYALQLFAKMRFQGLDLDYFSYHILLNSLVEADLFEFADNVVSLITARGLAGAATACIKVKSLCRQARLAEAETYLRELMSASEGSARDRRAIAQHAVGTLVNALCNKGLFHEAGRLVEEFGAAVNVWVSRLVRARKPKTAMDFLQRKQTYLDEKIPYNNLIGMLLLKNQLKEVYDILVGMMEDGIPPDSFTMSSTLCFFCKAGMVDVAIQLYNSRLELGMSPTSWVYEHLISALCCGGNVDEAYQVLEESMQQNFFPGDRTLEILATLLYREGKLDKMYKLIEGAFQRKMRPTTAILAKYFSALCKSGQVEEVCNIVPGENTILGLLGRYKYTYINYIHALIKMKRSVNMLPFLIIKMQEDGHSPSRRLYREVLCCLCEKNMFDVVLDLLNRQLELKYLEPRNCYNFFIDGAAHSKKPEMAREVYNRMVTSGIEPNVDTDILMLQGYLKSMRIGDALNFFHCLLEKRGPNTKLYNVFICGLCEANKLQQAVVFWREARDKSLIPSLECYEQLVHTLCSSGKENYDIVIKVLEDFEKTSRPVSAFLCNVLLLHSLKGQELCRAWVHSAAGADNAGAVGSSEASGSGRLGPLGRLIGAFSGGIRRIDNLDDLDEEIEKFFPLDTFTYNMFLKVLIMAGKMDSAWNMFHKMRKKGYEPNRFSFDIILRGYCKHRRKEEAMRWMEYMHRNGYKPTWDTLNIYNNTP